MEAEVFAQKNLKKLNLSYPNLNVNLRGANLGELSVGEYSGHAIIVHVKLFRLFKHALLLDGKNCCDACVSRQYEGLLKPLGPSQHYRIAFRGLRGPLI